MPFLRGETNARVLFLDDPAAAFVTTRPINQKPGSQENFTLARCWVAQCLQHHKECPKYTLDFMPRMVLKVARTASDYRVILHYPSATEPYTALSYCWGGDQPQKTTKDRIRSGNFVLDWALLPESIKDAVKVTIGLGYSCLWVDSLCIVQDDDSDKAKQIALMPQIYSKAVATISASKAERAVDGFLQDINLESTAGLVVRLPIRGPDSQTLGTVFLVETRNPGGAEPIEHRGWTLQERYLSPRVLDYARNQLSWSCTTSREQQGYCDGWRAGTRDDYSGRSLSINFYRTHTTRITPNGCHEALSDWHGIVQTYTRRRLTLPTDRILAVSGIAERFSSALQGRYFAGHWDEALPYDLLWSIEPGTLRHTRPAEYQAPSWSWAAVSGSVTFRYAAAAHPSEYPAPKPVVFDLAVHTELEEVEAPFGAVKSGYVRGRGRMRPARWFGNRHAANQPHTLHDEGADGAGTPIPLLTMRPDAQEREFSGKASDDGASIEVHLLHVGTCIGWGLRGLAGLVLRQLPVGKSDEARRRFVRLGIFHVNDPSARKRAARGSTHPPECSSVGDNQDFFVDCPLVDFEII